MSKKKIDVKNTFFLYDEDEGLYKCTIDKCNSRLKGASNSLKRHIAIYHPDVSKTVGIDKYKPSTAQDRDDSPKAKKMKTISLEVDEAEFLSGLVELAAIQGVAFNVFDSSGFKKTAGILAKALGMPNHADAIVLMIQHVAEHVREIISEEMKGTLFCLKFDGACRHNRKILGITAQFIQRGKLMSRILSIEDMTERQTGENLKQRINDVLDRFKLDIKNVYAATTDNGKNMVKCTEILRDQQELSLLNSLGSISEDKLLDADLINGEVDYEIDEEYGRKLMEDDNDIDNLITKVDDIISSSEGCIESIKCGAHTFNLIVKDALATVNDEWLKEIRKMVKTSKRVEYRALFTIARIPLPKLDVETRWSSTWDMVESIEKYELIVKEIGSKCSALRLSDDTWARMKDFKNGFECVYSAVKALQSENIIMGDLLKIIKQCQFSIKKLPCENPFVRGLNDAIDNRIKKLVDNNAFRAAMLFDPRWCFLDSPFFSKEDKIEAIVST